MQAIEFWSTVCDCETSVLEDIRDGVDNPTLYLKLVERAAPLLVPIMLETLTKQQVHLALPAPSCSSVFDLMLLHCPVLF